MNKCNYCRYWKGYREGCCPRCGERLEGVTGPERQLVGESRSDEPQADVEEAKPGRRGVGEIVELNKLLRLINSRIEEALGDQESARGKSKTKPKFYYYCEGQVHALTKLYETLARSAAERSDLPNS